MSQNTDFAALIGSRICHDLISPIGAINNGIELLEMSSPNMGPEMSLISESVTHASARIRFFRIAFGAASTQMVGRSEVLSILKDIYAAGRLTVAWGPMDDQERNLVQLGFLAILCMEAAMPYGGRIEIDQSGSKLVLNAHADKFNMDPKLWDIIDGTAPATDLKPSQVQFGLLPQTATNTARRAVVKATENKLTLTV